MITLDAPSRGALAAAALACFTGALVLAPQTARGAAVPRAVAQTVVPADKDAGPVAAIMPTRDPFGDGGAVVTVPKPAAVTALTYAAPPALSAPLPANLPNGFIPSAAGVPMLQSNAAVRLTAVVTGAHPSVVAIENGKPAIKSVGDIIDGARIRAIRLNGAALDDGRVFSLSEVQR